MSLSAPSASPVTMIYGTGDGTATAANGDYTPTWGTLTFSPGQTSQTVAVPVAAISGSSLPDQTFYFAVGNPVNGTIARQEAMATIVDSVMPPVVPTISVSDATVQVGSAGTRAVFTVNLSAPTTSTVTMIYGTGNGTATAASGAYTPTGGTLTFSPGQTSETISVPVAGVTAAGLPNQTFFIAVANPVNGTIARQLAMATLVNSLLPTVVPTISVVDTMPVQVGSTSTQAVFTVNLSAATTTTVTMFYGTGDGTATAASGAYTPTCGTLTFSPGQTSETISVPVAGMNAPGLPNQSFFIAVANPVNGTISRQLAMATLVDAATTTTVVPTISLLDAPPVQVGSAATQAVFTVNLSAPTTNTVTMFYGTGDGTATAASGAYKPTCGTLTFSPGQTSETISVPVAGMNAAGLPNEAFFIAVGNPVNGTIARQLAMATIVDSLVPAVVPTISLLDATPVQVGNAATQALFTVNLSAASTNTVTMFYGTGDGTATAASGAYTPTCGTLTFSPGQTSETISVPVAGMNAPGLPNQAFFIAVGNPVNGTIARQLAMATIVDAATTSAVVPTISLLDAPPVQVGSTATQAVFTVDLSAASTSTVTMFYGTGDGTATAASGAYTPTCGTLTFSPGQTSETIAVPVAGMNAAGLPNEAFFIAVGNPVHGTIARQLAMATLVNAVPAQQNNLAAIPAARVPTISLSPTTSPTARTTSSSASTATAAPAATTTTTPTTSDSSTFPVQASTVGAVPPTRLLAPAITGLSVLQPAAVNAVVAEGF